MPKWPNTIPEDLRHSLEPVLSGRNKTAPQDVWGAVQEWLQKHDVSAPGDLPQRSRDETFKDQ